MPAPSAGWRRVQTPPHIYWKCQIGRRIRLARERAGKRAADKDTSFRREDFARSVDMLPQRLWEIENGLLSVDSVELALIAQALGVHPGAFYDDLDWNNWSTKRGTRVPAWLIAKTVEDLPDKDRALVECLIMRLQDDANKEPAIPAGAEVGRADRPPTRSG
jgi:transcriptional regulator with XRE-family HTH domain